MSRPQLTHDLLSDPDEERSRSSGSDSEGEGGGNAQSAQDRKREALYLPISSICAALGGQEEFKDKDGNIYKEYSLGDQVIGCLKDLKRFWRMDEKDDDRTVARIFFEVGVLERDLIPILFTTLGTGPKGDRIALACVELIGAMTWPINVAEELRDAQLLDELTKSIDYNSLIDHQLAYKAAILRTGSLKPMFQLMSPALAKSRRDRTPKDENIISLVLHTFRNLVALKDRVTTSTSASALELSSLQSDLIVQLANEHIFDLLIAIAHNADSTEYAPWNMVALDIFHLIFRAVRPAELMVPSRKVEANRLQELLDLEEKNKPMAARNTNTRHSRFGTTVALRSNDKQYILHKQSTLTAGAEKTMDQLKKAKAVKVRKDDDLQPPVHLKPEALRKLYAVGISFLDSAFNPFFSSVLKDIRMERLKVKESDTIRYLFLSRFFLEFFLLVHQDEKKRGIDPTSEDGHDFDVVAELVEPMAIVFVTTKIKGALEEKPPLWVELHAGVDCFTQILLVIEAMSLSGREEHVDTAEILQNKLYYDADTLELCAALLRRYDHQSNKFLDAIIHLAYVLLRMLEKYSKHKAHMFVRRKKANRGGAQKKKKTAVEDEEGDGIGQGADEEEEEAERGMPAFKEAEFDMGKFEQKFVDEAILETYMIYLSQYPTFNSPQQMKRIVNLLHRIVVKVKCEALLFKPSVIEQFQTIVNDRAITTHRDPAYHDLVKLIDYVLKKFFKVAREYPMLMLEIFFPKSSSQLIKHSQLSLDDAGGVANPYASSDEDGLPAVLAARGSGEVEVAPGFSLTQQIGIAMRCLTDAGQEELIGCVQRNLRLAAALRTDLVLAVDGEIEAQEGEDDGTDEALRRKALRLGGPSEAARETFEPVKVVFSSEYLKEQASVNQHFRLLMRLLTWVGAAPDSQQPDQLEWHIPVTAMPQQLEGDLNIIDGFLLDPVDPNNGKSAADLLRKKRKPVVRRRRARLATDELEELGDDSEDGEEVVGEIGEVTMRAKRPRKKATRKRKAAREEGDGEGRAKGGSGDRRRAKARKEKEAEAYRSAQFIEDSDFDEAADAAFFEREAAFRAAVDGGAVRPGGMEGTKSGNLKVAAAAAKGKGKGRGKGKAKGKKVAGGSDAEEDEDEGGAAASDVDMASASAADSDSGSDGEEPSATSSGDGRKRGRVRSASTAGSSASPAVAKKALFHSETQESAVEDSEDEIDRAMRGAGGKKRRVVVADSDEE